MEEKARRGRPPLLDEERISLIARAKPGTKRTAQNAYYAGRAMALLEDHPDMVPEREYLLTGGKGKRPRECVFIELGRLLRLIERHVSEAFAARWVLGLMKEISERGTAEGWTTRQAEAFAHARRMEFGERLKSL